MSRKPSGQRENLLLNRIALISRRCHRFIKYPEYRMVDSRKLEQIRGELLEESQHDTSFIILIIASCLIATLGLLSNSAAVIIGAMIIAPLMLPIRGLAFGAIEGDILLFRQGMVSLSIGTGLAVALSWGIGSLSGISTFGAEILARSKPNLLDLGIAIGAGCISGYAKTEPKVSGTLAGTAIAVALMPPLCVVGLGLNHSDMSISLGALLLYLTNLLGITLSCMVTFLVAGYTPFAQARRPLTLAGVLTIILLIPLTLSFINLVRQSRLETSLRESLLGGTVTFQRVELIRTDTNWFANPPEVRLVVRSRTPITPEQVRLLEEFVATEMSQKFILVFEVSQVDEVRREPSPEPIQDPEVVNP